MSRRRLTACDRALLAVAGGALIIGAAGLALGMRLNFTDSAPTGLWMTLDVAPVERGQLVEICTPDNAATRALVTAYHLPAGRCASGSAPLLKAIAAVPGDAVAVGADGVLVNGVLLANTAPAGGSIDGVSLDGYDHATGQVQRVAAGHVWVVSSYSPASYDSRYFGPLPATAIAGRAVPVLVRGDAAGVHRKAGQ